MSKLDKQIEEYLKLENPEYFEGLKLYSAHPSAKRNVVRTCEQRYKHGVQQAKLIYELENLIGAEKYSGKRAILKEMPNVPFTIIKETEKEVPQNFEYSVKFEDLPEELQELVIEKGIAYNRLEVLKKEITSTGIKNDDKSVLARQEKRAEMEKLSKRIKAIHAILSKNDNGEEYDIDDLNEDVEKEAPEVWDEENLNEEYKYQEMTWAEKKLLYSNLQSSVAKQLQRAKESKKEETKQENALKAAKGGAMLDVLKAYFDENPEAPK